MKKLSLLSLFIIATVSVAFSQHYYKIYRPTDPNTLNDSTLFIYGGANQELISKLNVVNIGSTTDTVLVKRVKVSVLGSTVNEICWALQCYDSTHNVSDNYEIIAPGDTAQLANDFNGDYFPFGRIGTSTLYYIFFNKHTPTHADTITVSYVTSTAGVANINDKAISFLSPYPNPAGTNVTFGYSFSSGVQTANLKIFNMLGECVQTLPLNTSKTKALVNVQSIPSGIYICEIQASGCQPAFQKLVVSH